MAEASSDLSTVYLSTFYAPNMFWIIFEDDISSRDASQKNLNSPLVTYSELQNAPVGQKVIANYEDTWFRAEIVDIRVEGSKKEFICWFFDYGYFVPCAKVFEYPVDVKALPPFAKKATMYGLRPVVTSFDFGVQMMQETKDSAFTPGIRKYVDELYKQSNSFMLFRLKFECFGYLVGDFFCRINGTEQLINLRDKICSTGLAKFNDENFMTSLQNAQRTEKSLMTVYLHTRCFPKFGEVEGATSKSRGTFRNMSRYLKDNQKKPRQIPDTFFSDEETEALNKEKYSTDKKVDSKPIKIASHESYLKPEQNSPEFNWPTGRGKRRQKTKNCSDVSEIQKVSSENRYDEIEYSRFEDAANKMDSTAISQSPEIVSARFKSIPNKNEESKSQETNISYAANPSDVTKTSSSHAFAKLALKQIHSERNKLSSEKSSDENFPISQTEQIKLFDNNKSSENDNVSRSNDQIKSAGRGLTKSSFKHENIVSAHTNQIKSIGHGKSSENDDIWSNKSNQNKSTGRGLAKSSFENDIWSNKNEQIKSSGRGLVKSPEYDNVVSANTNQTELFDQGKDFESNNISSNKNDQIKSCGRGLTKSPENKNVGAFSNQIQSFGHGKDFESDNILINKPDQIKTSGRGLAKYLSKNKTVSTYSNQTESFDNENSFESDNISSDKNDQIKSFGRGLTKSPENKNAGAFSNQIQSFGHGKDFESDNISINKPDQIKISGRGLAKYLSKNKTVSTYSNKTESFGHENSFESENISSNKNDQIKSSGRGLVKSPENKNVGAFSDQIESFGHGKDFESDKISSNKNDQIISSGRGLAKYLSKNKNIVDTYANQIESFGHGKSFESDNISIKTNDQTKSSGRGLTKSPENKNVGALSNQIQSFGPGKDFENDSILSDKNDQIISSGRGLKKSPENKNVGAFSNQIQSFGHGKDFESDNIPSNKNDQIKSSGRGLTKYFSKNENAGTYANQTELFDDGKSYESDNISSNTNDQIKSFGRGLAKSSSKNDNMSLGLGKSTITDFDNDNFSDKIISGGRGFKKSISQNSYDSSCSSSSKIKEFSTDNNDQTNYIGRGLSHVKSIGHGKSFESDNMWSNQNDQIKSSGRGLAKSSSKNDNVSLGLGKSTITDFDSDNSSDQIISGGRGFKKTKSQNSYDSSGSSSAKIKEFPNDNNDQTKYIGRGLSISSKSSKSISSEPETQTKSTLSSEEPFEDVEETLSNSDKSSMFRDSSSELSDLVNCFPAGAQIKNKSKETSNQNFQFGVNQKRPPSENTEDKTVVESVKEFEKTFKEENAKTSERKHKQIAGLCNCDDCPNWRNNENVFKPVDQSKPTPKPPKVINKPPLLFKTNDQEIIKYKIHTEQVFHNNIEKLAAPRLLVHGYLRAEPASDLTHIPFGEDVQKALRTLNFAKALTIQTYAWPAILRGHNTIVVSGPDCGKTMVYVPSICSFIFNKHPELPDGEGPIAVIICPRFKIVEDVYRLVTNVLSKITRERKVVAVVIHNKVTAKHLKEADVVITTPRLLIEMLKNQSLSFRRLCHVVFEEIHDLYSLFTPEMNYILNKTQKVLENRTDYIPIQIIAISQKWTLPIEKFAESFRVPPLICIGANLEAALYGKANIKIQITDSKEKAGKLIQVIKDVHKVRKTVIICNDDDDGGELFNYLNAHGIVFESLLIESAIEEINTVKRRWLESSSGSYFVLVCSDNIFNTGLVITDAEIVVQYSLPVNWTQYTFRFSAFLDKYSSPLAAKQEEMTACYMHILVDDTNWEQFPRIMRHLKSMGTKLPKGLLDFNDKLILKKEEEKLLNNSILCEQLLCFGSCQDDILCKYRHMLSPDTDISNKLPKSGLVKFKLLHTESPMKFYGRLIEHTDSENVVHEIEDNYNMIATELSSLKYENNPMAQALLQNGVLCAVQETDARGIVTFERCKILNIVTKGQSIKKILVRFIDIGKDHYVLRSQIYFLPPHLANFAPQAIPFYIANIGPPDCDVSWPKHSTTLLRRNFKKAEFGQANCFFTGRIKLQVGDALFLDDLKLQELLDDDESLLVYKLSVCDSLRTMCLFDHRPQHLEKLYQLCEKYEIPLQDYDLPVIKKLKKIQPQVQPNWAHLENLEEFNMVYFSMANSPDSFFVKLCKNTSCLEQLNKDIASAMSKPFYRKVVSVMEGQCYLVKDSVEHYYARAIVKKLNENTAECLFVDYGDTIEVAISELKYLPDYLITQLPFQAIECKLYGIEPAGANEQWLSEATDIFYDIAYEPNTDYLRYLHVKIMDEEKTKYFKKYSVILVDTFEQDNIVNNIFLDLGYAIQVIDKRIVIDFDKIQLQNCDTESAEDEREDLEDNQEVTPNNNQQLTPLVLENIENQDGDDDWEFYNPDDFIRTFLKLPKEKVSTANTTKIQEISPEKNIPEYSNKLKALPMPTHGYSTPNIVWQQTNTHVTLRIQIPAVKKYQAQVLRSRIFIFKTHCDDVKYKTELNLYAKVNKDIEHSNLGLYVLIKMEKEEENEWPRLIVNKERQRFITYNVAVIPVDDDSDDENPLPVEKIQSSKKLGQILEQDEEDGSFVYEYGSDIDWDESDVESEYNSDDS